MVDNAGEQHEVAGPSELEAEQIEQTFRTNVFSFFYMIKHALPHMKSGGSIINTTSVTAYKGNQTLLDYSATKGAIVALTRSLSQSLMEQNIRVNAVAPGPIWTRSFRPRSARKIQPDTAAPLPCIGPVSPTKSPPASCFWPATRPPT